MMGWIEGRELEVAQVRGFSCVAALRSALKLNAMAASPDAGARTVHSAHSDCDTDGATSHFSRQPEGSRQVVGCRSCKGFSLFELIVVICIVAVLASVFLGRVLYYQEQAEKAAMVGVAGTIQSALLLQYGRILTHGKASDVDFLAKDNPMNWLQQKAINYAGEFHDITPLTVEPGNWVFDLDSRDLIYVLHLTDNFKSGKDGKQWIRYHVTVKYETSRLPSLQNAPPELTSILFEPVEPYSWF